MSLLQRIRGGPKSWVSLSLRLSLVLSLVVLLASWSIAVLVYTLVIMITSFVVYAMIEKTPFLNR